MARRLLPIGIQSFRNIRESNCYYVDKTGYALRLVEEGSRYFLSRPRRFGKSLFVDTLKELFEGRRELFEGLEAYDLWDWSVPHPVVRLDFGAGSFDEQGGLQDNLVAQLEPYEHRIGSVRDHPRLPDRFAQLLSALHKRAGKRVVVLVDEFDKPIVDVLEEPRMARANRRFLRSLYSVIKSCDAHVRFCFLTGVSKFSKVSLFSGLNNLIDITLEPSYSSICGFTERDLDTVFAPELAGLDRERVRDWYNGYSWGGAERVYNPFDALLLFRTREFKAWWFETGTPTFLVETLVERTIPSPNLNSMVASEKLLGTFDVGRIATEALLFQTGYLTIRNCEDKGGKHFYRLGYPNREVRESLNESLLEYLSGGDPQREANSMRLYDLLQTPTFRASNGCSMPFSRASRTSGTTATRSPATRDITRASSTRTSQGWGWMSPWRTAAAAGGSTWQCERGAECTCLSSSF